MADLPTTPQSEPTTQAPSIECPLCGETVVQVASATLSLALAQHVNWVCLRHARPTTLREALNTVFAARIAYHWRVVSEHPYTTGNDGLRDEHERLAEALEAERPALVEALSALPAPRATTADTLVSYICEGGEIRRVEHERTLPDPDACPMCDRPTTPALPQDEETLITGIVQEVAELPNRTSPDEWPEAMLVTAAELSEIVRAALRDRPAPARAPEPPTLLCAKCDEPRGTAHEFGFRDHAFVCPVCGTRDECIHTLGESPSPAPQEAETPRWQPIETAPRDRTTIIGYTPHASVLVGDVFFDPDIDEWTRLPGEHVSPTHWTLLRPPSSPSRERQ